MTVSGHSRFADSLNEPLHYLVALQCFKPFLETTFEAYRSGEKSENINWHCRDMKNVRSCQGKKASCCCRGLGTHDMEEFHFFSKHFYFWIPRQHAAQCQLDQIGRFFALRATIQSRWQQLFYPNCPHCKASFVKVSKPFIFLLKSFLGSFDRHLAIFIWSHCSMLIRHISKK